MPPSRRHSSPAGEADTKKTPGKEDGETTEQSAVDPSVMGTNDDYQLARTVDMLRGIALFNGRVGN